MNLQKNTKVVHNCLLVGADHRSKSRSRLRRKKPHASKLPYFHFAIQEPAEFTNSQRCLLSESIQIQVAMSELATSFAEMRLIPTMKAKRAGYNMDIEDVLAVTQKMVVELSEIVCTSEMQAESWLERSRWNVEDAAQACLSDTDSVGSSSVGPVELKSGAWQPLSCVLCLGSSNCICGFATDCGSAVCFECWRKYCAGKLDSDAEHIVCPMPNWETALGLNFMASALQAAAAGPSHGTGRAAEALPCIQNSSMGRPSGCEVESAQSTNRSGQNLGHFSFGLLAEFVQASLQIRLSPEELSKDLNYETLLGLFCLRRARSFIKESIDLTECPTEKCPGIIRRVDSNQLQLTCSICELVFCWNCKVEYHWPLSCANTLLWKSLGGYTRNEQLSEIWLRNDAKPCPKSGAPSMYDVNEEGCSSVVCAWCQKKWKWEKKHGRSFNFRGDSVVSDKVFPMPKGNKKHMRASERNAAALSTLRLSDHLDTKGSGGRLVPDSTRDTALISLALHQMTITHRLLRYAYLALYFEANDLLLDLLPFTRKTLIRFLRSAEKGAVRLCTLFGNGEGHMQQIRDLCYDIESRRQAIGEICVDVYDGFP